jgi:hypothetical protein
MTHTSTLIHSRFPYLYPSFLLHESQSHDDHIYVHVYIDVLHKRQVTVYADLGCTLPFACKYAKSNPRPCAFDVHCVQLRSYGVKLAFSDIDWCLMSLFKQAFSDVDWCLTSLFSHQISLFKLVTCQTNLFSWCQSSLFSDPSPIIVVFSVTRYSSLFSWR